MKNSIEKKKNQNQNEKQNLYELNSQSKIKEFDLTIEKGKKQYEKELNDYNTYISNLYLKLKNELKKKQQDLTQLNCLLDTLSSENEDLHLQLQETQNEITEIKSGIENLKKSMNVKDSKEIFTNDFINTVCKKLQKENLMEHPKFHSYLKKDNIDSFKTLKVFILKIDFWWNLYKKIICNGLFNRSTNQKIQGCQYF